MRVNTWFHAPQPEDADLGPKPHSDAAEVYEDPGASACGEAPCLWMLFHFKAVGQAWRHLEVGGMCGQVAQQLQSYGLAKHDPIMFVSSERQVLRVAHDATTCRFLGT